MERPLNPVNESEAALVKSRSRLATVLAEHGLQYAVGGRVVGSRSVPARTLQDHEFDRATQSIDDDPREAVSAADNILESVCKLYIGDERLETTAKQDLRPRVDRRPKASWLRPESGRGSRPA